MKERGFEIGETEIIARTGWRTDDLLRSLKKSPPTKDYNLVSLLIGVNNQFQGSNFAIYPLEFRELINQAIAYCGGDKSGVFVLSIPDYGYTPFGGSNKESIGRDIDRYNEANRKICEELGISYIDITPISREAEEKPYLLASDNLHPSGIMYGKWVDKIIGNMNFSDTTIPPLQGDKNDVTIYPNPAFNKLKFTSEKAVTSIVLSNLLGDQILSEHLEGIKQFELDISSLNTGIYLYRLSCYDKQTYSGKIIVR